MTAEWFRGNTIYYTNTEAGNLETRASACLIPEVQAWLRILAYHAHIMSEAFQGGALSARLPRFPTSPLNRLLDFAHHLCCHLFSTRIASATIHRRRVWAPRAPSNRGPDLQVPPLASPLKPTLLPSMA